MQYQAAAHAAAPTAHNRCARSGSSRERSNPRPTAADSEAESSASLTLATESQTRAAAAVQDLLPRHPKRLREHRAQALVPPHQIAQRTLQRRAVQLARKPHRQRDHISRTVGARAVWACAVTVAIAGLIALQPVQEPQPPLRIRQRDLRRPRPLPRPTPASASTRRSQLSAIPSLGKPLSQLWLQRRDARRLKQAADRDLDIQRRPDPADQPHRQQRVPAQLEEVVVEPDPLEPQHLGKQRTQDRLLRRPRRTVRRLRRQAPAQAARGGRACRSASAATAPAPRSPTAPCSPAAPKTAPTATPPDRQPTPKPQPHSRQAAAPRKRQTPRSLAPSCRATTTACDTPACRTSAASISPGSIRKPRSLSCASARPRNSSTPSPRHRARSPVRYIRPPAATPCGSATNRSAVSPERCR